MRFSPIYYLSASAPTLEATSRMLDLYVSHGARDFQLDLPSRAPVYETELVKGFMREGLERYEGFEPYLNSMRSIRQRHPNIGLHLVLYPDVIEAIGTEELRRFMEENRVASLMVAGADPETVTRLRREGFPLIGRINRELDDAQLQEISAYPPEAYFNFNYKRHSEQQPHGCVSFKEKIDYIRGGL